MEADLTTILNIDESDEVKQQMVGEYLLNFQNQTGISYEELSNHYKELSNEYLGFSNKPRSFLSLRTRQQASSRISISIFPLSKSS